jgi:hypothetical protein
LRGELHFSDSSNECDWVICNGNMLTEYGLRTWRKVYPPPIAPDTEPDASKQGIELNDFASANEADGLRIAEAEYQKRLSPGTLQVTLTGFADWAFPGQFITILHPFGSAADASTTEVTRVYETTNVRRIVGSKSTGLRYELDAKRVAIYNTLGPV